MNGLRIGTPELVRWGVTAKNAADIAKLIASALSRNDPEAIAPEVAALRGSFDTLHFIN